MSVLHADCGSIDCHIGNQLQQLGVSERCTDPCKEPVTIAVTGCGCVHFKSFADTEVSQIESSAQCLDVVCNDFGDDVLRDG